MLAKICGNCAYWNAQNLEHFKCKKCSKEKKSTERVHFMPRNMNCPLCECEMTYNQNSAFLKCGDCGIEIWPFVNGGIIQEESRNEFERINSLLK
jgi:uncharacterized Zn ribbon protein